MPDAPQAIGVSLTTYVKSLPFETEEAWQTTTASPRPSEQLRAEKAAREEASRQAAERAELERLRAEKSKSAREAAEDASIAEARARGRKLMEPDEDDEDLKMPAGQKMVLGVIALVVVVMLLMQFLGGR